MLQTVVNFSTYFGNDNDLMKTSFKGQNMLSTVQYTITNALFMANSSHFH